MVRGENTGQTFQFIDSDSAELGFVACSQDKSPGQRVKDSFWKVPQALYDPVEQQAVLLKESKAGRAILWYVQSEEALAIILDYGYDTP